MDQELQQSDITSAGLRAFLGLEHGNTSSLDDAELTQPLIQRHTAELRNDRKRVDEDFELLPYPG